MLIWSCCGALTAVGAACGCPDFPSSYGTVWRANPSCTCCPHVSAREEYPCYTRHVGDTSLHCTATNACCSMHLGCAGACSVVAWAGRLMWVGLLVCVHLCVEAYRKYEQGVDSSQRRLSPTGDGDASFQRSKGNGQSTNQTLSSVSTAAPEVDPVMSVYSGPSSDEQLTPEVRTSRADYCRCSG